MLWDVRARVEAAYGRVSLADADGCSGGLLLPARLWSRAGGRVSGEGDNNPRNPAPEFEVATPTGKGRSKLSGRTHKG